MCAKGLEMLIGYVLDRKQAFLETIKISIYLVTKLVFPKGLVHDFVQKFWKFFTVCFCAKKALEMMFGFVLKWNQAFLDDQNIDFT